MGTSKPYPEPESASPSKVAESVSPYIIHSDANIGALRRKPELRVIAGLPASEVVWQFVQEHALLPHIETAVRSAHEHFTKF
jgi:hypothetical protein